MPLSGVFHVIGLPGGVGVGSVAAWIMAGKRKSHSRRNAVFLAVSMPFLVKQCVRLGKENPPGQSGKESCCKDFFRAAAGSGKAFSKGVAFLQRSSTADLTPGRISPT